MPITAIAFALHIILFDFSKILLSAHEVNDFCSWENYFVFALKNRWTHQFYNCVYQMKELTKECLFTYLFAVRRHRHLQQIVNWRSNLFSQVHHSANVINKMHCILLLSFQCRFLETVMLLCRCKRPNYQRICAYDSDRTRKMLSYSWRLDEPTTV